MTESLPGTLDKLSACIHCGMCLPVCPTYRVTGSEAESPRGRLYLMREYFQGRLADPKALAAHMDPCLGCLACTTACPSGVDYNSLLMHTREKLVKYQPRWKRWLRRFLLQQVLPNPRVLRILALLTQLYQQTGLQTLFRLWQLPRLAGPLGGLEQFIPTIHPSTPLAVGQRFGENLNGRVALFTGCIMNAAFSRIHQATVDVLVANGYEVVIPPQTCCGALAHHSGETDIAGSLAAQNLEAISAVNPDWIVVNAAGCGAMLKDYPHLFVGQELTRAFAHRVVDIMELLAKQPLQGLLHPVPVAATYHAACHLHHAQHIQEEPYWVLRQIPGLQLEPLTEAEMCCGSAGVYNLAHPEMSLAILQQKMTHLKQTSAQVVLTGNPGCAMQLEAGIRQAGLEMTVRHPVELIAQAYRAHTRLSLVPD